MLAALIVFILLGVEAFRSKSDSVSSVGSVLEGASGAGSAYQDKLGDKEQDMKDLVSRFAKKKAFGGMNGIGRNPTTTLELNDLSNVGTN